LVEDDVEPPEEEMYDQEMDRLYRIHWDAIRTHQHITKFGYNRYNKRLENQDLEEIKQALEEIYERQMTVAKWNISFGYVLYKNITDELTYYYANGNTRLFEEPVTIGNRADFDKMLTKLDGMDILEWAREQRPNAKYVVARLTNLTVYIDKIIRHPMGP
jgi:hypothetical protein